MRRRTQGVGGGVWGSVRCGAHKGLMCVGSVDAHEGCLVWRECGSELGVSGMKVVSVAELWSGRSRGTMDGSAQQRLEAWQRSST